MPAVRETLERVRLNRNGAGRGEPGTVGKLITQQPLHALLINRIVRRHASREVQRIQRLTRRIGVRANTRNLAPASVFVLLLCFWDKTFLGTNRSDQKREKTGPARRSPPEPPRTNLANSGADLVLSLPQSVKSPAHLDRL